ncbi:MAG TPA: hypothetical protein VLH40_05030 [Atribacteraceae bacterium]|nr:hypothetical protein [Atribacteraceae bacterium]
MFNQRYFFLPQLRNSAETYSSKLGSSVKGNSAVSHYLVAERYPRGLSTRDIEATFTEEPGKRLIGKGAVSEDTETPWEACLALSGCDLSGFDVSCIFLGAVYEPTRTFKGPKEGILCAWVLSTTGEKIPLPMLGNKESRSRWLAFSANTPGRRPGEYRC